MPAPLTAAGVGGQLRALGEFIEASVAFWLDVEEGGRTQGVNCFRQPAALTGMGAAAENVSTWGSWSLADDEALVIEVTPPPCPLLECLPRELLVGDDRLRQPAVEPQRPPGSARPRRRVPGGRGPRRPGAGQLARHRRQPPRGDDLPLAPGRERTRSPRPGSCGSPTWPSAVPVRTPRGSTRRGAAERCWPPAERPSSGASRVERGTTWTWGCRMRRRSSPAVPREWGRAIAERLAAEGAEVAVLARGRRSARRHGGRACTTPAAADRSDCRSTPPTGGRWTPPSTSCANGGARSTS